MEKILDAIRKGDLEQVLAQVQAEPALVDARDPDGVAAVRLALYYRRPEISRALVEHGAALDVHDAAASGRIDRLKALVAMDRAVVNRLSMDGATPLGLAAFLANCETVQFLLDHGADIDMLCTNPAFPFTALHSAMAAGHRDTVDLLLARGANVNVREGGGFTVLHEAAVLGSVEYVQLLMAHGANLPEDFAGRFPALWAEVAPEMQNGRTGA
jgi:uncharacterized protein